MKVLVSAAGIYSFYLYYGVLQERIYRAEGAGGERFSQTLLLLAAQCLANWVLGAVAVLVEGGKGTDKEVGAPARSSPWGTHSGRTWLAIISVSYLCAMGCSNQSLQFVSYPFQALAKSCKMVPVMLGGVLLGGKRYRWYEYLAVLLITGGVLLFQLDKGGSLLEGNTAWGMGLLFASLVLDGLTSSNQDLFSHEYGPSGSYMMREMNFWSLLLLLPLLAVTGEGTSGLAFALRNPHVMYDIVMFALCSAVGQQFIFFCIVGPGPLVCTTITTTRKFFTVLLSVLWFPDNKLSNKQWLAVALVFAGISIELVSKRLNKRSKEPAKDKKH
jgi:UDP-galactose transporter B1